MITSAPCFAAHAIPCGDVGRRSGARGVEHAHRHQLRAVGDAGEIAGRALRRRGRQLLADRRRDVGAVAVLVERPIVVVDEVDAGDELPGREVGRPDPAALGRGVGDAGVDDRDRRRRRRPGRPRVDEAVPGPVDADPARGGEEVPLVEPPAPEDPGRAAVERVERRAREVVRVPRRRPRGGRSSAAIRPPTRLAGAELDHPPAAVAQPDDDLVRRRGGRRRACPTAAACPGSANHARPTPAQASALFNPFPLTIPTGAPGRCRRSRQHRGDREVAGRPVAAAGPSTAIRR